MYASIRQGKAKPGMAEELTRRIKEGAIPIISDVEGFMGYYVVYAPDDTVTAISIFKDYAGAEESNIIDRPFPRGQLARSGWLPVPGATKRADPIRRAAHRHFDPPPPQSIRKRTPDQSSPRSAPLPWPSRGGRDAPKGTPASSLEYRARTPEVLCLFD